MSEDETRVDEQDEVEAHKRHTMTASDEAGDEAERDDDNDFEAHRRHSAI